jgi:hypothetical protein
MNIDRKNLRDTLFQMSENTQPWGKAHNREGSSPNFNRARIYNLLKKQGFT